MLISCTDSLDVGTARWHLSRDRQRRILKAGLAGSSSRGSREQSCTLSEVCGVPECILSGAPPLCAACASAATWLRRLPFLERDRVTLSLDEAPVIKRNRFVHIFSSCMWLYDPAALSEPPYFLPNWELDCPACVSLPLGALPPFRILVFFRFVCFPSFSIRRTRRHSSCFLITSLNSRRRRGRCHKRVLFFIVFSCCVCS